MSQKTQSTESNQEKDGNKDITITKCKESWNREEIIDIIKKYNNQREDGLSLSKWIEENL